MNENRIGQVLVVVLLVFRLWLGGLVGLVVGLSEAEDCPQVWTGSKGTVAKKENNRISDRKPK